jgi:hypothetical protein
MGGHCRYLKTDPRHQGPEGTYGPHHQPADQHTAAPASNHKRRASLAQRYAANTSRFTDSPLTVTTFTHPAWARGGAIFGTFVPGAAREAVWNHFCYAPPFGPCPVPGQG